MRAGSLRRHRGDGALLSGQRHCPPNLRRDDAQHGRLAGMPRGAPDLQGAHHHADCPLRRKGRAAGI